MSGVGLDRIERLRGHGIGRHPRARIVEFAIRDVDALAAVLGDKPFLADDQPCGADAFVFGIVTAILTPPLDSLIRTALRQHANLVAYCDRMTNRYFSGHPESAPRRARYPDTRRGA
jgi:glutathione S-transferase